MEQLQIRIHCRRGEFTLAAESTLPLHGVTGIYGPSGSGKTTLLNCLAGLIPTAQGSLVQLGDRVWQDRGLNLPTHRRGVGFVFQDARLFPHLDVRGNLRFAAAHRHSPRGPDFDQVCEWLQLAPLLQRSTRQLSRGQQQRVAIARTLLNHPALLLLDEPLANIDIAHRREILNYLEIISRELQIPIILVSHNMEELARLADWLVVMEAGRICAAGPTVELCSRLELALAQEEQAAAILSTRITGHDAAYGISELAIDGQAMFLSRVSAPVGSHVRLRVPARDVSLCLEPPARTSILNILRADIDSIEESTEPRVLVRLRLGSQYLLARITRKSLDRLALAPGMPVYAQIKSVALLNQIHD